MKNIFTAILLILILVTGLSAQQAEQAALLGTWRQDTLVGSSSYNNTYNEVWGLAVNGREYGVIGSTAGTHFIDVTDPAEPVEVAFLKGAGSGPHIIHRDFHNYGCYLYAVADEGASSLQIIDVSNLPESISVVYDSDELIRRSHNIFIDTLRANLYAFDISGGNGGYSPMRVFDISNPVDPVLIRSYDRFGGENINRVHDGFVQDGLAYLNCGYDGFFIVDFDDPANAQTLGVLTDYPAAGYNHSGWPTEDRVYYYMADENHGYDLKTLKVDDPTDIEVIGTFDAGISNFFSIPHNQIVACNYLYVSYYYDGLRIFDISDPENPQLTKYYDTCILPHDNTYEGAWGVYPYLPSGVVLVSDMQRGLFVVEGPGDSCGAREESRVNCLQVSAIADNDPVEAIKVFPQPAADHLNVNINLTQAQNKVKVSLYDVMGRPLLRLEDKQLLAGENNFIVHLPPDLPRGLYLLRLENENFRLSYKVIRQ